MHRLILVTLFFLCLVINSIHTKGDSVSLPFDSNAIVVVKVKGSSDFCSGVVVASKRILTATHCVYNLAATEFITAKHLQIGIGDNVFDNKIQWFEVTEINELPALKIQSVEDFLTQDIIQLTGQIPDSITPLSLARSITPDSTLIAWGFGEDEWGYYGLKKSRPLTNHSIQGELIHFSSGACRGDSGGPILDNQYQVVGIISMSKMQHCVNDGTRLAQRIK